MIDYPIYPKTPNSQYVLYKNITRLHRVESLWIKYILEDLVLGK